MGGAGGGGKTKEQTRIAMPDLWMWIWFPLRMRWLQVLHKLRRLQVLQMSSQQSRPVGWTANMLSLARFSTEWMLSGGLRPTPPEAVTDQRQRSRSLTVEQRKFHLPSQLTSLLLHKNVIFTTIVLIFCYLSVIFIELA